MQYSCGSYGISLLEVISTWKQEEGEKCFTEFNPAKQRKQRSAGPSSLPGLFHFLHHIQEFLALSYYLSRVLFAKILSPQLSPEPHLGCCMLMLTRGIARGLLCDAFEVELVDLVQWAGVRPWVFEFVDGIVVVDEVVGLQVVDEVVDGVVIFGEDGVAVVDGEQILMLGYWQIVDGVLPAFSLTANPTITDKILYNQQINTRDQLSFLHPRLILQSFIHLRPLIPLSHHYSIPLPPATQNHKSQRGYHIRNRFQKICSIFLNFNAQHYLAQRKRMQLQRKQTKSSDRTNSRHHQENDSFFYHF